MEHRSKDFARLAFVDDVARIDGEQPARFERDLAETPEALRREFFALCADR